ncbi:MAG: TIGR03118 family protein [Isosphaeraceae bacterium]
MTKNDREKSPRRRGLIRAAGLALALAWVPAAARADVFAQTNLVSNRTDVGATFVDPNLKNPWGISSSATSPMWVSNQVTGNSTLYNSAGTPQALVVTVPGGSPTGQVSNSSADFALSVNNANPARFLFATLSGTIAGWNPSANATNAITMVQTPGAVYTGLGIGNNGSGNFLYAADTRGGGINVFNGSFANVTSTVFAGKFVDPTLPTGFRAYNVQNLNNTLYVTYQNGTLQGGVVDAFDLNGNFLRRISANGAGGILESPWGVAIAPTTWGSFANALLVGNKDDGRISAFNSTTGAFLGQLSDAQGTPLSNLGLWGLQFGNGGNGGDPNTLYFAAGINGERDGLFGAIRLVPEPSSIILLGSGLAIGLAFIRRYAVRSA